MDISGSGWKEPLRVWGRIRSEAGADWLQEVGLLETQADQARAGGQSISRVIDTSDIEDMGGRDFPYRTGAYRKRVKSYNHLAELSTTL